MTGKSLRYPILKGKASVSLNGKTFSIEFEERTITLTGQDKDLLSTIPKMNLKIRDLSEARRFSKLISKFGITLKLADSKGPVCTFGKGVWTPLGHLSFKPRIRKYLGRE